MRAWKRAASFLMAVVLLIGMLPLGASAAAETYLWPVPSCQKITSGRGWSSGHNGIDIQGASGAAIYATKSGVVVRVFTGCNNTDGLTSGKCQSKGICSPTNGYWDGMCNSGFGNGVIIKHTNADGSYTYSHYAHMLKDSVAVKLNQTVTRGQLIGKVGNSGNAAGNHLHFSLCTGTSPDTSFNNNIDKISYDHTSSAYSDAGTTTPTTPATTEEEYLAKCTVTNFAGQAYRKNSTLTIRSIPAASGTATTTTAAKVNISKKVINAVGNTWYKTDKGYFYSGDVTVVGFGSASASSITTNDAYLKVTASNPNKLTIKYGGIIYGTSNLDSVNVNSKTALTSGTGYNYFLSVCAADYQTKTSIPSTWKMKSEVGATLKPNTTYYVRHLVIDSNNRVFMQPKSTSFKTLPIKVSGVTVSPTTKTICVGKSFTITPTIAPTNASNKNVTWKSSNTAVATVSAGKVTAVAAGTATITATAADGSGNAATCAVTVKKHAYTYAVTTAPTTSAAGVLTGTCSTCKGTTTVTLPKLDTTNYTYAVKTAAKCTTDGTGTYTWKTTTYGTRIFNAVISKTGHKLGAYTVAVAPTTSKAGKLTATCSSCGNASSVTLPALDTTNYSCKVLQEPTENIVGTSRYTWKTTTYGTFFFDVLLPKLNAKLTGIQVAGYPRKTVYERGEELDTAGLCLELSYSDGSTHIVTSGYSVEGYDPNVVGLQVIMVYYEGRETSFEVKVNGNEYTITYALNKGKNNADNPSGYSSDDATITLKKPTRKGYTFKGWYKEATYETKVTTIPQGSTGNIKLYAKWAKTTYKIVYKLNKGKNSAKNPATYNITTPDIKLAKPTRPGCVFLGWYKDAKYKQKITSIPKGSTGNLVLYARWKKK